MMFPSQFITQSGALSLAACVITFALILVRKKKPIFVHATSLTWSRGTFDTTP
jgi:hypothetical protein